jgi:penicillin-binding protein 1B
MELAEGREDAGYSLLARLARLGYRRADTGPTRPGEFVLAGKELRLALREFDYPEGKFPGDRVRLQFRGNQIRRITSLDTGRHLEKVRIEPELIATFYQEVQEERTWYSLEQFPEELRRAVLSVEDRNYFHHAGVDPRGRQGVVGRRLRDGRFRGQRCTAAGQKPVRESEAGSRQQGAEARR